MRRKNIITSLALTICMCAALLGGCGKKSTVQDQAGGENQGQVSADQTVIKLGVFETDNITAEIWQSMIDAFEADHPEIKVEKVLGVGDDRTAFWKTLISSGNLPDIVIAADLLAAMDGVLAEVPLDVQQLFEESLLCQYHGKCITIPAVKQYRMQCYYNKAEFEALNLKEPATWEDFQNICQTVRDAGKIPLMCGGTSDSWAVGQPYWIAVGNPAVLSAYPDFNQKLLEGSLKWNNEVTSDVLARWQEMIEKGYYYEGVMSLSYSQAAEEFKKGTAVMMIDGSWQAAGLDAEGNEDFGVFAVPAVNGENSYCVSSGYWGVSEASKNKEAAFQFIKYIFDGNQEPYKAYLMADGTYSTTKKEITYEQGPLMTKLLENIKDWSMTYEIVKLPGDYAMPSGLESFLDKSFQNIFNGADIASELESWDTEYQRLLEAQ